MSIADAIVGVESGGNPYARNPRSSAAGAGQFINSTWLDMVRRTRPDLAQGRSDAQILALRVDPGLSRDMTAAYARENGQRLTEAGFEASPGNTYLAHFAGPGGALKVLQADPAAPARDILGPDVVKANPFLANMTTGELRSWADRKMGAPIPPAPIPMPNAMTLPFPSNAMASAQPQIAPAAAGGPPLGMLAGADMSGAPGQALGLLSAPGLPAGAPQPAAAAPMFRPPRDRLQAAALGVPAGQPVDLAGLMGGFGPRPMNDAEQAAWFARMNPTG